MTEPGRLSARTPRRWSDPLKVRSVWIPPITLVAILILAMTLVYFGSVVNPAGHLRGLPVAVVDQDAGATVGGDRVDFGQQLAGGLISSPAVSSRLGLRASTLAAATDQMDVGSEPGLNRSSQRLLVDTFVGTRPVPRLGSSIRTLLARAAIEHRGNSRSEVLSGVSGEIGALRRSPAATGRWCSPSCRVHGLCGSREVHCQSGESAAGRVVACSRS